MKRNANSAQLFEPKPLPDFIGDTEAVTQSEEPDEGSRIIALDTKYGKRNPDLEQIQIAQDKFTAEIKDAYYNEVMKIAVLSREAAVTQIKDAEWDKRCADEKAEFGLSVNEAAVALCEAKKEALMARVGSFLDNYKIDEPYKAVKLDLLADIINKLNEALKAKYTSKGDEG